MKRRTELQMSQFLQTPSDIMGLGNGYFQPVTLQNRTERDHGLCPPADRTRNSTLENSLPSSPLTHTNMCVYACARACVCVYIPNLNPIQAPNATTYLQKTEGQKNKFTTNVEILSPTQTLGDSHNKLQGFSQQINYTKKWGRGMVGDP